MSGFSGKGAWRRWLGLATGSGVWFAAGCERPDSAAERAAKPVVSPVPATATAPATRPALPPEPTRDDVEFLRRPDPLGLRFLSFNVNWDSIFPDKDERRAAKFARIFRAVAPDIVAFQEVGEHSGEQTAALLNEVLPLDDGQTWHAFRGTRMVIASRFPFTHTQESFPQPTYRDPAIAVVDLPDERFGYNVCILNNHFKCCDAEKNDPVRQSQADANMNWVRDARTEGGALDLPPTTAFIICGDLNLVGGKQPLDTLWSGNVIDEATYGVDFSPDWDETPFAVLDPRHNCIGPNYTWRNDLDKWPPGRLDYVIYSDSLLFVTQSFLLNTATLTDAALQDAGLERWDVALDEGEGRFDHFPIIVDFAPHAPPSGVSPQKPLRGHL